MKELLKQLGVKGGAIASTVVVLFGYALVPLPGIEGENTGFSFTYKLFASPHIAYMTDWVIALDGNQESRISKNKSVQSAEWQYFIHKADKPKKYEYDDRDEYIDAMRGYRREQERLDKEVKDLKQDRSDLIDNRQQLLAQSPIRKLWSSE